VVTAALREQVVGAGAELLVEVGADAREDLGLVGAAVHEQVERAAEEVDLPLELRDARVDGRRLLLIHGARVTASTGEVDSNGDVVGERIRRIGTAVEPPRYRERPGLDARLTAAGADVAAVAAVRRMLRVRP
jgi:hypothetical protein